MGQDGFDFAGEGEDILVAIIIKRFLPHAVARQQQALLSLVPQGDRVHAAQALPAFAPIFFVQVGNGFAIAIGTELIPALY